MFNVLFQVQADQQRSSRAREIAEQRRSNASGIHGKVRKDRRNKRREAIEFSRRNDD